MMKKIMTAVLAVVAAAVTDTRSTAVESPAILDSQDRSGRTTINIYRSSVGERRVGRRWRRKDRRKERKKRREGKDTGEGVREEEAGHGIFRGAEGAGNPQGMGR